MSRYYACVGRLRPYECGDIPHTALARRRASDLRGEIRALRQRVRLVTQDLRLEESSRVRMVTTYENYQAMPCTCDSLS